VSLQHLLDDPSTRERTKRLLALLGPGREALVWYLCDPLLSVDLLDPGWVEKFDAEHPTRRP